MKILKILGLIVAGIVILAIIGVSYVTTALPDVGPPPSVQVEVTPELVKRGAYLANSVAVCMDCHSTRDWSRFSGPLVENTLGQGGELFTRDFGFPGYFVSKNITPAGIGEWTDGELYRLITSGVNRNGDPIFPVMPYPNYNKMATEDVYAIIAYLRTLQPIENVVDDSKADFPVSIILHTIPKPANPQPIPDKSEVLQYGAYMANAAACNECHTPRKQGGPDPDMVFAGGFEFKLPGFGVVRSANLTPAASGLKNWTEEQFVTRFKMYADSSYTPHQLEQNDFQTVMPWVMYASMEEEDLRAIFAYLQSIEPIENTVQKFTPETML